MNSNWRKHLPVLVTEAHTVGALAVIRSLGRAGYPIHCCSNRPDAMGFASRYSSFSVRSPGYDAPHFIDWISDYMKANGIKAIIPSELFLLTIRPWFKQFSPFLAYPQEEQIVFNGMSKVDQLTELSTGPNRARTAIHLPPFLILNERMPSRNELAELGFPLYIKMDGCYSRDKPISKTLRAETIEIAEFHLASAISNYRRVLIEGHVRGKGVGAFFLRWNGQNRAEFMHLRIHEVPHTGGVSSYRMSWWHNAILDDALLKLTALRWKGVAMMEYRWDLETNNFHFIEMNGRFWGSLHLALRAGVDFPVMLMDLFHGREVKEKLGPPKAARCRCTFPDEIFYVRSVWKDRAVRWDKKIKSLLCFIGLGLSPAVGSDLWWWSDTKPYWIQLIKFFSSTWKALTVKLEAR
jgi:predicted ATP-grasp superfamily ATP-dependent carboligase